MKKLRVINEKISYTYNLYITSSMNSGKKEKEKMMKDKTGKWKLEIKRGGERRVKRKSESRGSWWSPAG